MADILLTKNGQTLDLSTNEGAYKYLSEFLVEKGADSLVFECATRLYSAPEKAMHWVSLAEHGLPKVFKRVFVFCKQFGSAHVGYIDAENLWRDAYGNIIHTLLAKEYGVSHWCEIKEPE